jgi:hypothetical protein
VGLVIVAMFNLVFQPCTMAMEMDVDHDCPHCPTIVSHDQHQHNQQFAEVADCDYLDFYSYDKRTTESKAKDSSQDLPVIVADIFPKVVPQSAPQAFERASHSAALTGGPPLSILYCVYLK